MTDQSKTRFHPATASVQIKLKMSQRAMRSIFSAVLLSSKKKTAMCHCLQLSYLSAPCKWKSRAQKEKKLFWFLILPVSYVLMLQSQLRCNKGNWGEWWMSIRWNWTGRVSLPVAVCAMKISLELVFCPLRVSSFPNFNCDASWELLSGARKKSSLVVRNFYPTRHPRPVKFIFLSSLRFQNESSSLSAKIKSPADSAAPNIWQQIKPEWFESATAPGPTADYSQAASASEHRDVEPEAATTCNDSAATKFPNSANATIILWEWVKRFDFLLKEFFFFFDFFEFFCFLLQLFNFYCWCFACR